MRTHDPRQVIEDLRHHLAAHDRRLSFLFGAGTSSAVSVAAAPTAGEKAQHRPLIPGIQGLTEMCEASVSDMGEPQRAAWGMLVTQCQKDGRLSNVESILSSVRMKVDAMNEEDYLVGLNREQLRAVEATIRSTIANAVNPKQDLIPDQIPHDDFASWVKKARRITPLEIYTTNYDLLLERALESARIPVFDGFVGIYRPFFYPESLDDDRLFPREWIGLWKLHGSVNWQFGKSGKEILRGPPDSSGEMILPSHRKYDESRKQPYIAFIDRMSRMINSDHALLIVCGYSFSDEHINAVLFGALDNRHTANIVALQYGDLREDDAIVVRAVRCRNLTVIGRNGGVIAGAWGLWQLSQPVDNKAYSFMDLAFDSNAFPEEEASPAAVTDDLGGRMRLGDFLWFSRFLRSMGANHQ